MGTEVRTGLRSRWSRPSHRTADEAGREEKDVEGGERGRKKKICFVLILFPIRIPGRPGPLVDKKSPERLCGLGAAAWVTQKGKGRGP